MNYSATWKVLDKMIAELRGKGAEIPEEIVSDLRYAKTLINILKADPSNFEVNRRLEESIQAVESYLISEAMKHGNEYVDAWLKRLEEAERKNVENFEECRFVPGLPRDKKWIRVKISDKDFQNTLMHIAEEAQLSFQLQEDGYMLVYGEDEEKLKNFLKKIALIKRL